MDFRLLGPVEVWDEDRRVPLGGPQQQALLVRLLLDVGRPVSAARLIEDLWGERQPLTAAKLVQVHVSQLRKVLPEGLLVTRGSGYALEADREALDLHRFERLRGDGLAALAAGDAARAATRLREALALWRGPALTDFREPFAAPEAARLEELRLACLEDRVDADLALGRHADVAGELEALVRRHRLRERLREQLMLALYRAGRQAEALAAYQALRAALDETLGIAPSPAVQQLHVKILQQAPELLPAPPEQTAPGSVARGAAGARDRGVSYATAADGARLAYAVHGRGSPLVRAATWLTDVELDWQSPVWRHWLEGLGEWRTVLRYDERGCGRSERELGHPCLDQWVGDLEAVIDDAGFEQVDLLGISQGGPIAVAYAARHPERVRRVVLYGAYLRGRRHRGDPLQARESAAFTALIRSGWGSASAGYRRVFTNLFLPRGTEEQMRWYDDVQRRTADGETVARLREARDDLDVTDLARRLTQPTLVLHATGDRVIPIAEGRLAAELIPGARFVELGSDNHILLAEERAWGMFLGTLHRFLEEDDTSGPDARQDVAAVARRPHRDAAHG
jgi:DNA-binding SARP family transcriptional activator/pimeloyl-ACP methyl ester carboxylesterase